MRRKQFVSRARDTEEPLVTEGMTKEILLQALRKKIYFEKTVAASYAANNPKHCAMALPAGFVKEHGDKFEQSVRLWSGSCMGSWRVHLSVGRISPYSRQEVKLCGGWRAFATDNDLAVGDSLIFCLRAMSEFDVYVFRETKSNSVQQTESVSVAPRKRPRDFELLAEKLHKSVGYKRRNLVAENRSGRVNFPEDFFEKTLTTCAVSRSFQLTLPTGFMHRYALEIEGHVDLQSVADGEMWTIKINIYYPDDRPQFMFDCGAWRAFAVSNGLVKGDRVKFTLVAKSTFRVLILRCGRSSNNERSPLKRPVENSKGGSTFSQTWQPPAKSLRPQHRNFAGKSSVKMEREFEESELLSEEEDTSTDTSTDSVSAYSASDSSSSPSDVDSDPTFERWSQGKGKRIRRQTSTTQFPMWKSEFPYFLSSGSESE